MFICTLFVLQTGSGPTKANEIKAHPFFNSIDWEKLAKRQIQPPFKPNVQHSLDTSNLDDEYTNKNLSLDDKRCDMPPNYERFFEGTI